MKTTRQCKRNLEIVWQSLELSSSEHCVLTAQADGWLVSGTTVLPINDVPGHIEYTITVDERWATQHASVAVHRSLCETYEIMARDGWWTVNGEDRPDLEACVDIDLGWTPATNTLPIRRLNLEVGDSATTTTAWFRFPEMRIEANEQRYTRIADRAWRYIAGTYDFRLEVDEHGRVLRYGDDLWRYAAIT